jgi:hypothetical protein
MVSTHETIPRPPVRFLSLYASPASRWPLGGTGDTARAAEGHSHQPGRCRPGTRAGAGPPHLGRGPRPVPFILPSPSTVRTIRGTSGRVGAARRDLAGRGGRTRGPKLESIPPLLRAEGSTAGSSGRGFGEGQPSGARPGGPGTPLLGLGRQTQTPAPAGTVNADGDQAAGRTRGPAAGPAPAPAPRRAGARSPCPGSGAGPRSGHTPALQTRVCHIGQAGREVTGRARRGHRAAPGTRAGSRRMGRQRTRPSVRPRPAARGRDGGGPAAWFVAPGRGARRAPGHRAGLSSMSSISCWARPHPRSSSNSAACMR